MDYINNAITLEEMQVEYGILHSDLGETDLCEMVTARLNEGWELQGGVALMSFMLPPSTIPTIRYAQAIVRYVPLPKEDQPEQIEA